LEAVNPPAALRRLNGRVALRASAVTLFVYLVSGTALPDSQDTTPNAYVPVSLLAHGDLAFTRLEAPVMFLWSIEGPKARCR